VVQRVLGHATAAMTMDLYGHLVDANSLGRPDLTPVLDTIAAPALLTTGARLMTCSFPGFLSARGG
jgi:hypothetical protein